MNHRFNLDRSKADVMNIMAAMGERARAILTPDELAQYARYLDLDLAYHRGEGPDPSTDETFAAVFNKMDADPIMADLTSRLEALADAKVAARQRRKHKTKKRKK